MTDLSPETPEENLAEEVAPEDRPDAEEYAVDPGSVSETTGTVYGHDGEPATTPQDQRVADEDDDE